eukprot:gene913-1024_t
MSSFIYNLSSPVGNFLTTSPFAVTYEHILKTYQPVPSLYSSFCDAIRTGKHGGTKLLENVIARAGWHLSNFKSPKRLYEKLESYSHTEFNKAAVKSSIVERVRQGKPLEFIVDGYSYAYNAENVFLKQQTRRLTEKELQDEEFRRLVEIWERHATEDDMPLDDQRSEGEGQWAAP